MNNKAYDVITREVAIYGLNKTSEVYGWCLE